MISRIGRVLKEGFYGVGRHAAMSLSSASAVTITLIIISIFAMFMVNVQEITKTMEGTVQISVLVDYSYESQEQIDAIGNSITAIEGVDGLEYYTKEQEFDQYISTLSDEEKPMFEPYREDNPFHNAYYVNINENADLKTVAEAIQGIEGVYEVNYGGESAIGFLSLLDNVRNVGLIIVGALSLLAIFLIYNTIKLTILARSDEIAIMRNVGAKNGFIRGPFVIEGIIIGILGAVIPILVTVFGYIYLYNVTGGYIMSSMFTLIPPHPFVLYISLFLVGIGILVGLIGSFFSVTKYLRWKR